MQLILQEYGNPYSRYRLEQPPSATPNSGTVVLLGGVLA
jgi:hypothetical protein